MSFTTVDNVKLFLARELLTVQETAQVAMLISQIDSVITNYCGWNLLAKDYVDIPYDGSGTDTLDLRVYPVNTVTRIAVDNGDTITDSVRTQNLTDITADVKVHSGEGIAYYQNSGGTFTKGKYNILVSMNAGYTPDAIPADLAYAASYLVVIAFNRIDSMNIGVSEEQFNSISAKYDNEDIPVLVKRILDRYRAIHIY